MPCRSLRFSKKLLLLLFCCIAAKPVFAQIVVDPTVWTYEVRKKDATHVQLIFHCAIKNPDWHIYSMKPGGDGSLIPPSFTFDKSSKIKLLGKLKEQGKLITEEIDAVGTVHYYKGSVDYVQEAQLKPGARITGRHEYQVCSSAICLAPKTLKFAFNLK